ncbi:uncharacterized protein LOC115061233 [Echeneis naucrates]|uniref:uncharacterized protein LOC115061233 n=1 Tax=Echeneis naucrates TaxID=173247 RepID=UPI001113FDEE|nr:uncharacterized protein LOC115061233 [Echeneis naucrates]XP_029385376.1 uncharacterized protein LOC115061233 [Echeneis naucrates]XP_029385377.1 uncharacterized protein LOC115061233 [Echeneis naucrates]XP_029385378.1 uncharacterized protein LOC115061233 [Echeneis naucrates]
MLSSTVVTVLAPHWSGQLQQTKRTEGTGNSLLLGSLQDVTHTASNYSHEHFQETVHPRCVETGFVDGFQPQIRVPLMGTKRNTMDWSVQSGPARLDCESRRKMPVSLDVSSDSIYNKKQDAGNFSTTVINASPLSSLRLDPNEQKKTIQVQPQGHVSPLGTKPTTSSLLLTLRGINSSGRSSNAASTVLKENPLPTGQNRNLLTTHLSEAFHNNIKQEGPKCHLSPPSISCRMTETKSFLPSSSLNLIERNIPESCFFSPSPTNTEETPFTQKTQIDPKLTFLRSGPQLRQQDFGCCKKNTKSYEKHSPYDPSALPKTRPPPRGTTLTSTSWWKQVTPEGSSPLTPNGTSNIKNQVYMPCNENIYSASPSQRLSNHVHSRAKNNSTESVYKGNMNVVMETRGRTHNLKQRNAEDSPDHKSDGPVRQHYGSSFNIQQPQKSHHLPKDLFLPEFGRTLTQTNLISSQALSKCDVNYTSNGAETPVTSLNPKSLNNLNESSRKHNNYCSSKTNSILASHLNQDFERFTNRSCPPATTIINSPFHPMGPMASSQTTKPFSSQTGCSPRTPKFTNTSNAVPLRFEKKYNSMPKPFCPKTVSSLIPAASDISKTSYNPVFTQAITSSPKPGHGPSIPTPPATPVSIFSPTTTTLPSLLTHPATLKHTRPNPYTNPSSRQGKIFSSSAQRDLNTLHHPVERKKVRRAMKGDSIDLQNFKPDPSGVSTSLLTPKSPQSVLSPSVPSFLRPNSPTSPPLCSPSPKNTSIQVVKGGKYRSVASVSADITCREHEKSKHKSCDIPLMKTDQGRQDLTTPRQEQESGTAQCSSSMPCGTSPPDFSSSYKLRYSTTPYCILMSSRSTPGETKTLSQRSPLFQPASPTFSSLLSLNTDPRAAMIIPASKPRLLLFRPPQTLCLPFQNKAVMQKGSSCMVPETDQINGNYSKSSSLDHQNGQILLVNNRFHISAQCSQDDEVNSSNSTCITETLVYNIKSKVYITAAALNNTMPEPLQDSTNPVLSVENKSNQQLHRVQRKEMSGKLCSHLDQSSRGGSSSESHFQADGGCSGRTKESVLGKGKFFSEESSSEQSPKRSWFAMKRSVSTANSTLLRSDSQRHNKTNNKMDQVLNRLRQTLSTRWTDDDLSFPWKWKKSSHMRSVQEGMVVLKDKEKVSEGTNTTPNKCIIISPSAIDDTVAGNHFSASSKNGRDDQEVCAGQKFSLFRDSSPSRSSNQSSSCPCQCRKSTSNPRTPLSPSHSLSPLSPLSTSEATDDNVFYSPKLQHCKESSSPCGPGDRINLGGSRKSRAARGPPSPGPGQGQEHFRKSSYADLKYGIEPGRSFSVSSVLSSRPSGPGRIATGSRFMSVGDLSGSSLTCGGSGKDWDLWTLTPNWTTLECGSQHLSDCCIPYFHSDPGKIRSRSLPQSLTRHLAGWSSGVSVFQPVTTTASKSHLWSPNMNTCQFAWDTEGPLTPPPTPPLSPVSRRLSNPPGLSSPIFPSSSGVPPSTQSHSARGHLPSRDYISNLSTFEESSDSSSDTTDDEYYLIAGEGEEKETEL